MQCEEGTEWLLELLTDVQLQQYFLRIRDELNVTRLSHFDYVKNEDLEKIGMGRPGQRRLWEAVKRRRALYKRKSWMSKVQYRSCPADILHNTQGSARRARHTIRHYCLNDTYFIPWLVSYSDIYILFKVCTSFSVKYAML
uniref:non-specific protein-tyrosine kinase n=1 Tax=Acanthochromis polyacanthus TaxID=80966 RepID=A0A3Q1F4G9_9TELE